MNKRIKELLEQATEVHDYWHRGESQHMVDHKMFAELIIQECIQCGNVLAKHYIDTHTEKDQAMLLASIADYSSEIRKHFGVEK